MEEVDGSNPSRSTKFLKDLAAPAAKNVAAGVQMESKFGRQPQDSECQSRKNYVSGDPVPLLQGDL